MRWLHRRPVTFDQEIKTLNTIGGKIFAPLRADEPTPEQWREALRHLRQFNEEVAAFRKEHYGNNAA